MSTQAVVDPTAKASPGRVTTPLELLLLLAVGVAAARVNQFACLSVLGGGSFYLVVRHRNRPADVVGIILAVHCIAPFLRRLNDFWHSYNPGSPILIASYCAYPALGLILVRHVSAFRSARFAPAVLGSIGIGWAYLVGIRGSIAFSWAYDFRVLGDGILPPTIQLLQYSSGPLAFGYVVVMSDRIEMRRLCGWIAALGSIEAAYGLFQWVSPPAWDVIWFNGSQSFLAGGFPRPFMMRTFGTLNIVSPFAYFLAFSIVTNIGLEWMVLGVPLMVAALVTTQARSSWGTLVLGLAMAILLSKVSGKLRILGGLVFASCVLVLAAIPASDRLDGISRRVQSIQKLHRDNSFQQRSKLLQAAVEGGVFMDPVGTGLGASGAASRVSGSGLEGIDNGFLQTAWLFGWTGAFFYLGGFVWALGTALVSAGRMDLPQAKFCAIACALFAANLFESSFEDMKGALLWFAVGLAGVASGSSGKDG